MTKENIEIILMECLKTSPERIKEEDIPKKVEERALDPSVQQILSKAMHERVETVWDRLEKQQPHCKFCETGVSCQRCAMGPCRIMGGDRTHGVCGADAHLIVARNLLDQIATGAAAHSDHGREVVETLLSTARGESPDYGIEDKDKLMALVKEYGVDASGSDLQIAERLALAMMDEFGTLKGELQMIKRLPKGTFDMLAELDLLPRSIDREIVECMHRVHMGVGADYANILVQGVRASLGDGWGGSMIGTEISDVLFGTPQIRKSTVNLGVLKKDHVNVALHGHNPILSEMVIKAAELPEMKKKAVAVGAKGINLVGLCCTGNELLMRKGVPQAGNHLSQELVIATGALEAMIVDYQCIFPSLPNTAACYHTKVITTSPKAKIPGGYYLEVNPENAFEQSKKMLDMAIENFPRRKEERILIPNKPMDAVVGFSVESLKAALGGSLKPLLDLILEGKIRGCVGIVGCNNPKIKHDYGHVTLAKELIKRNIIVVETGCAAIACAEAGLMKPEAADMAGKSLGDVCRSLGIPPVLHMGSCVDNTRILTLAAELATLAGVRIDQLPIGGAAPEWYSPKAVAIGSYFVGSGISVALGVMPKITGSPKVVDLLTEGLDDVVKAKFWVEPDPKKAASILFDHIEGKRAELGL
ncbi:MAG TPA: anaerobic carbon-monoxide dehydrogenase catalytic subunit [Candidatus Methanomethylophilaceae archaeon]|nr:anaerobic carbon-monoxide dehydrogenase catalytic subunit [Candidatus Methanomethylophilaceae archaeon]